MIAAAFARFKPLVRPQASRIGALTGLAVLGIAVDALLPWPLKLIIDHVIAHDPLPPVVEWIAALPGSASPAGMLAWLAVAMLALFLATAGLRLAESVLQSYTNERFRPLPRHGRKLPAVCTKPFTRK